MLDGVARGLVAPLLARMGGALARAGVTADQVTVVGFLVGMAGAAAIGAGRFGAGLVLLALSRVCDGLDGAVAKATRPTDFGGYLDIVLDFAFYGLVPLAFVFVDPGRNGLAGAALLFAFYANGASFLAYASLAERRSMTSEARGPKSIYFTVGLAEATETYIAFAAFCLFPAHFSPLAWIFAGICIVTALSRVALARRVFRQTPEAPE